jgi:serine protease Do
VARATRSCNRVEQCSNVDTSAAACKASANFERHGAVNGPLYLLEKVAHATVGIHSVVPSSHPSADIGLGTDRSGTGTLVSSDGVIVTVNYMVMGAQSVSVTLTSGQEVPATIAAQDFTTNIALLKIDAHDLPFLQAVSSMTCSTGQEILMVSSVGGEKRCADVGHITYLGPFDAPWEFVLERCLCVTASALNIGLNGGPICNAQGQIVGISYLNFPDLSRAILAIPGECFISSRDELLRHGRRVSVPSRLWLGVLSYTLREHVVITGVMPGSPGEKAGLRQGDVVLAADEREIHDRRAFYESVNTHRPGEIVTLKILRNNQVRRVPVTAIRVEDFLG